MESPPDVSRLCFSARLLFPFARLLRKYPAVPPDGLDELEKLDPDERIPISAAHELLAGALVLTGDADLGLKAAREIAPGDYGAVEYVARSAATWGEAADTIGRYLRLINDALEFSHYTEGDHTIIQLDSLVPLPRASADFQSAAFHISAQHFWETEMLEYEVWFAHAEPIDTQEYLQTFGGGTVRFGAPWNGFVVPRRYNELPIAGADPKLHELIRKHAEAMLAELPRAANLTERVRDALAQQLAGGPPSLRDISRGLGMSERTLARHLEEEGTAFKVLLEDLRTRLALRYVRRSELPFGEIAFLLGFSQVAAFHRAFRRWTGQTPLEYRKAPLTKVD